ncbi:MAG: ferrochelatase [Pseudomonadota bacterium]|jgi:ferrochelatase
MTAHTPKIGLLLLNVGTPEAPTTGAVRRYLAEFLSDPRVIDIPALPRWLLLHGIILRTRPRKSAHAYRAVWTAEGSPLLANTLAFRDGLRRELGEHWQVEVGMRYGKPSIAAALKALKAGQVDRLVVAPLFPQEASATTGTALEAVYRALAPLWNVPAVSVVPPFFDDDGFLEEFAELGRLRRDHGRPDHVLFSFHGLPERQIHKGDDRKAHCLRDATCCDAMTAKNRHCYRAQAVHTAMQIARRMSLPEGSWSVSFQSRLGRTKWIGPYTEEVLVDLAKKEGVKRLMVMCPAFVADCLESLEEIALRAKETFVEAGGEELHLVPSLNARPSWVHAFARIARRAAGEEGEVADNAAFRRHTTGQHARV